MAPRTEILDYVATFERAMADHSLACPDPLIPDGRIHRFDVPGDKPRSRNGWYLIFDDQNPTCVFGSWKTGQKITWSLKKPQDLSPLEREQYQQRITQARQEAEQERKRHNQEAAIKAQAIWEESPPALQDHPYLIRKRIQANGVRIYRGDLVIPAHDPSGTIATLQFIGEDRTKMFLKDGAVTGNYFTLGEPGTTIYVVEGFATGATVYEATGTYTVVAFDAGNLKPVALRLRRENPDSQIIVAADNDSGKKGNPGLTKAREAADAVSGSMVFPTFQSQTTNGKPPTDFNDLMILEGLDAVREQLIPNKHSTPTLKDALLDYPAMLSLELPERKTLFPFLPDGGIAMAYGPRGVGKTFFNITLAASLCTGTAFFRWEAPPPTGVLYVDGELDLDELRNRMTALLPEQPKAPLTFLTSHYVYHKLERDLVLTDAAVRQEITSILDDNPELRVLILDNISCLFSGIDEDKKSHWEPIQAWLVRLRHRGITTLLVHHSGKSGQQRGTSGREDSLDTVIQLSKPAGYSQQEGCHFEITFTKCRSAKGEKLEPLDVKLGEIEGRLEWTWKTLAASKQEQVAKLLAEGVTKQKDIAEELGITEGYVSRLIKKIKKANETVGTDTVEEF